MTRLFSIAIMVTVASVAAAQQAPPPKPPDQGPQQAPQGWEMVMPVVIVEAPARAVAAPGPLMINVTFDPAVPPIASAVRSGNVVTITTTAPHGLSCQSTVTINGVADASFNGTFPINPALPSQTSFTYNQNGPNATSGGGNVTITGATTQAEQNVINQARTEWQNIVQNSGTTTNPYPLTVRFTALPSPPGSTVLGCTQPFATSTGDPAASNMSFNSSFAFWEDPVNLPPSNGTDLLSVVRHELGHALGWSTNTARTTSLTKAKTAGIAAPPNGVVRTNPLSNVVTITTTSPHGLSAGQEVTLSNVTDNTFNGDYTITAVPSSTTLTGVPGCVLGNNQPNATSGNGSVTLSVFDDPSLNIPPRLNVPFITGSGMHPDDSWRPNDLMVPCLPRGQRRTISLYPDASLLARAYQNLIPMQFVDALATGTQDGSAANPWQTVPTACTSSPAGMALLLASETFHVTVPFRFCPNASAHVVNAARGGATVGP